jgi:hypothetical protein
MLTVSAVRSGTGNEAPGSSHRLYTMIRVPKHSESPGGLKPQLHQNKMQIFSFYLIENALRTHYKVKTLNAV